MNPNAASTANNGIAKRCHAFCEFGCDGAVRALEAAEAVDGDVGPAGPAAGAGLI
jgi:hypothetical protein